MNRTYGVVGDPIAQSLSPLIHNGWMRDHGVVSNYRGFQVASGDLPSALETLAHRGVNGLNVTMPHKIEALKLSADITPRAKAIGSANTLWRTGEGTWGADNTDAPGFIAALTPLFEEPITGKRALVLGAGGAARAVVYALCENGVGVTLANRTRERADNLAADFQHRDISLIEFSDALRTAASFDIVVNTTSIGFAGKHLDLLAGNGTCLYDISYGKAAKSVLVPAAAQGWKTADGLSMLVYQAAFSFDRWFKIMPDVEKGLQRARSVLEMA